MLESKIRFLKKFLVSDCVAISGVSRVSRSWNFIIHL